MSLDRYVLWIIVVLFFLTLSSRWVFLLVMKGTPIKHLAKMALLFILVAIVAGVLTIYWFLFIFPQGVK